MWINKIKDVRLTIHLISIFILIIVLTPLFSDNLISGWDTMGHFYLSKTFIQHLLHGQLYNYDTNWFTGIPGLSLYSPMFAILHLFFYLITFTKTFVLSFNLTLVFIVVLFYFSFHYFINSFIKDKTIYSVSLSSLFVLYYLFFFDMYGHLGVGLSGFLSVGLIPQLLGDCLFLFCFGSLQNLVKNDFQKKYIVLCVVLFLFLFLSHILTSIFAALLFLIFIVKNIKNYKKIIIIPIISFICVIWWIIPFLNWLPYSSGVKVFKIYFPNFLTFFFFPIKFISSTDSVPFFHIIIIILIIIMIFKAVKGDKFLSTSSFLRWSIISSIIIFGYNTLYYDLNMPFHYYRFWHLIMLLIFAEIIIFVLSFKKEKIKCLTVLILIAGFIFHMFFHAPLSYTEHIEQYPEYKEVNLIKSEIQKHWNKDNIKARVFFESDNYINDLKHYPSYVFAQDNFENTTGLLAESSISSGLLLQPVGEISKSLRWAVRDISYNKSFIKLDTNSHLNNFFSFQSDYIVAHSDMFKKVLDDYIEKEDNLDKIFEISDYAVYFVNDAKKLYKVNKPLVSYSASLKSFRELIKYTITYKDYPYQLIHNPDGLESQNIDYKILKDAKENNKKEKLLSELIDLDIKKSQNFECETSFKHLEENKFELTSCGPTVFAYNYSPYIKTSIPYFMTQPGHVLLLFPEEETTVWLEY